LCGNIDVWTERYTGDMGARSSGYAGVPVNAARGCVHQRKRRRIGAKDCLGKVFHAAYSSRVDADVAKSIGHLYRKKQVIVE
jgi:hypothetical protein